MEAVPVVEEINIRVNKNIATSALRTITKLVYLFTPQVYILVLYSYYTRIILIARAYSSSRMLIARAYSKHGFFAGRRVVIYS